MNTVRICIDHCLVRRGSALLIDWICFEIEFPLFWKWLFCEFIHSKNGMAFSRESHWFSFIICNTDWSIMGESISYYRVPYNNITDYSPVLIANCGNYIYWRACIRGWGLGVWLQCQKSWLPKCLLQVIPLTMSDWHVGRWIWQFIQSFCSNITNSILGCPNYCRCNPWCYFCRIYNSNVIFC